MLDSEFNLRLPTLSFSGGCNKLFKGAQYYPDMAGHISDPSHPRHKAELNHLSSIMQNKLADETSSFLTKVQKRLNLPASPYIPIDFAELL